MASDPRDPDDAGQAAGDGGDDGRLVDLPIEDELKESYLTYAMSVIVSRALPDVRDGLKPSQRRILVAMNDLNLGPASGRVKCAKISGDTSGNYHPHGESVIYPTLVQGDTAAELIAEAIERAVSREECDVLVLAVKPQVLQAVAQDLAAAVQQHQPLVVSIAAGVRSDTGPRPRTSQSLALITMAG